MSVVNVSASDRAGSSERALAEDARAREFLAAFESFVQAVRRARGATAHAADDALSLSQYSLLLGLVGREKVRVQDLASEAGIAASTATRILDTLERRDVVRRLRSPDDRRAVTVALTERGRAMLLERRGWIRARERAFYATLPQRERELAPDLLARLAALIDELATGPEA